MYNNDEDTNRYYIMLCSILCIVLFLLLMHPNKSFSIDRCQNYVTDIRIQHWKYFGVGFPYEYGVGQAKVESNCRADTIAFDKGMGLTQFMPATWKDVEKHIGYLDPYNPENSIRAQAWYMYKLHKSNWDGRLFLTYMFYNSGIEIVKKEYLKVGITDYNRMKTICKRKVIILKNGKELNLCNVGYDYPVKIYNYAKQYGSMKNNRWRYW